MIEPLASALTQLSLVGKPKEASDRDVARVLEAIEKKQELKFKKLVAIQTGPRRGPTHPRGGRHSTGANRFGVPGNSERKSAAAVGRPVQAASMPPAASELNFRVSANAAHQFRKSGSPRLHCASDVGLAHSAHSEGGDNTGGPTMLGPRCCYIFKSSDDLSTFWIPS